MAASAPSSSATAAVETLQVPAAVINNVRKLMGVDADGARHHVLSAAYAIIAAYESRGTRWFWSDVDAQAGLVLSDAKAAMRDPRIKAFQDKYSADFIADMEQCQAWLYDPKQVTPELQVALQNLQLWLLYATLDLKKVALWEPYARAICDNMPQRALQMLVSPLLKLVVKECDAVRAIAVRCTQPDATDAALTQTELYEPCVEALDYAIRDMLFDALLNAPKKVLENPALADRLQYMRRLTKAAAWAKVEAKGDK